MSQELRMNAYYFSFEPTGVPEIDRVLSAVACAGKAYHHTDQWGEDSEPYHGHAGRSPVEWIANAAKDAASALLQEVAEKEAARKGWHDQYLDAKAAQYRAEDALRAAQQEVERNAKDAARLDWLLKMWPNEITRLVHSHHTHGPSSSIPREAIDAALAVSQEKGHD